jgi:pilus assembly protein CpaE
VTKHQYHFYELAESVDRLDSDLLHSFVVHHPSGLDLLPAPDFSEPERHVRAEFIGQAVDFIRAKYEFVVVDCTPGLNDQNIEVLRRADHIYVVAVPEVPALRNVARILDYFNHHEVAQTIVEVVINRHAKKNSISDGEIEKAIRRKISWKVPNAYHTVIRTINAGNPMGEASESEIVRSMTSWAQALGTKGSVPDDKKKTGRSFLGLGLTGR